MGTKDVACDNQESWVVTAQGGATRGDLVGQRMHPCDCSGAVLGVCPTPAHRTICDLVPTRYPTLAGEVLLGPSSGWLLRLGSSGARTTTGPGAPGFPQTRRSTTEAADLRPPLCFRRPMAMSWANRSACGDRHWRPAIGEVGVGLAQQTVDETSTANDFLLLRTRSSCSENPQSPSA
jgi:hypothetical protein